MSDNQVPALPASGLLAFIERAARDTTFDVAKFAALLDRHEQMLAKQQKAAFNHAMTEVQAEIGAIVRGGKNPTFHNPYARLEDLDNAARPIYSRHGFSIRYGTAPPPREGWIRMVLTIAHRDGYSEEHPLDGPMDTQTGARARTPIQAVGATVTYLRRYLLMMVLNLVPANDPADDDGEAIRHRRPPPPPAPPPKPNGGDRWIDKLMQKVAEADTPGAKASVLRTALSSTWDDPEELERFDSDRTWRNFTGTLPSEHAFALHNLVEVRVTELRNAEDNNTPFDAGGAA